MLAMSALCITVPAWAATVNPVAAKTELKLKDGVNDIKTGDMVVRIVKSYVSTATASSHNVYTVFILPEKNETQWLLVTNSAMDGDDFNFSNSESGDSNRRAVTFYKTSEGLFAVQAEKEGLGEPANNMKKTSVKIRVFQFNQNWDVPMFNGTGEMKSKARYMDASDALQKEFFIK
ncbi:hypothetical protein [Duganella sp. Root336D2]|uniref:hypothetical protein n=1 Tax=Duganella sp. Root336D2 TaxID=1736518 RepID=UPI0012E36965|nr:hypothetical protein [Duganella sp. Root336D2]